MRNILLSLAILCGISQSGYADNLSTISGTWDKKKQQEVRLFEVENGTLKEIACVQLGKNNAFSFAFTPGHEAFYVIGQKATSPLDNLTFYFKPGDRLNVSVDAVGYTLTGKNTAENKEMARWHAFTKPLEEKAIDYMGQNSSYVDFFPLLEEKLEEFEKYKPGKTGNKVFEKAFAAFRKYDLQYLAMYFLKTPRSTHPQEDDLPDFYRTISIPEFSTSQLLEYPYGLDIYKTFILMPHAFSAEGKNITGSLQQRYKKAVDFISDEIVRGEITFLTACGIQTYTAFVAFEEEYGKHLVTDSQKQRMKTLKQIVADRSPKEVPAPDFKYPDMAGKDIALSDFKGKVVYIDIWATWCVFCIKEIPDLKKLEEEYHGKDIVFMSVSVDSQKDYEKWKSFVEAEQLSGIQLFAGDRSNQIRDSYKIQGIPRFILVGKDGKLIESNAPRPSSSEIRTTLDSALK